MSYRYLLLAAAGIGVLASATITPTSSTAFAASKTTSSSTVSTTPATTFFNPILWSGADPSVVYSNGYYYFTETTGNNVSVWKSQTIDGIAKAPSTTVWSPPATGESCCDIWAPELKLINGAWYIYFSADDGTRLQHAPDVRLKGR